MKMTVWNFKRDPNPAKRTNPSCWLKNNGTFSSQYFFTAFDYLSFYLQKDDAFHHFHYNPKTKLDNGHSMFLFIVVLVQQITVMKSKNSLTVQYGTHFDEHWWPFSFWFNFTYFYYVQHTIKSWGVGSLIMIPSPEIVLGIFLLPFYLQNWLFLKLNLKRNDELFIFFKSISFIVSGIEQRTCGWTFGILWT